MSKKKLARWNIPVSPLLDRLLEKAIELDTHVSKSDFIREAVREKLAKMGLTVEFTEVSTETGETEPGGGESRWNRGGEGLPPSGASQEETDSNDG